MRLNPLIRFVLFFIIILLWFIILTNTYSKDVILILLITGPLFFAVISVLGNFLLNKFPNNVYLLNFVIHYLILLILGSSLIIALKETSFWSKDLNFPSEVSSFLIFIFGIACLITVANLAIGGLGAPFAILLTERITESFLYKYSRNPMVISTLALLFSIGLYYKSIFFMLWVLLIIFPSFIIFLLFYEEKELSIRFGEKFNNYKKYTPRFIPLWIK